MNKIKPLILKSAAIVWSVPGDSIRNNLIYQLITNKAFLSPAGACLSSAQQIPRINNEKVHAYTKNASRQPASVCDENAKLFFIKLENKMLEICIRTKQY